jgi:hypothetical protein
MLRERYEQIRQRALERTAIAMGSGVVIRHGMRSWMETSSWEEAAAGAPALQEGRSPADQSFQQIVAVWASVLVGQAERSCGGQRQA